MCYKWLKRSKFMSKSHERNDMNNTSKNKMDYPMSCLPFCVFSHWLHSQPLRKRFKCCCSLCRSGQSDSSSQFAPYTKLPPWKSRDCRPNWSFLCCIYIASLHWKLWIFIIDLIEAHSCTQQTIDLFHAGLSPKSGGSVVYATDTLATSQSLVQHDWWSE